LLARGAGATYTGVDYSETMVAEATARNAGAVASGRVVLRHGNSASLPFESASFDGALALNTIYFWPDPARDLAEIRRALRTGGRFALGAIAPWSTSRPVFRHGFRFYDEAQLAMLLANAGFASSETQVLHENTVSPGGEMLQRDYFVVLARV
jgi:SAM-dependent methyltransferase